MSRSLKKSPYIKVKLEKLTLIHIQMCIRDRIVTARKLRDENSMLKRRDLKPVEVRDAVAATSTQDVYKRQVACDRLRERQRYS